MNISSPMTQGTLSYATAFRVIPSGSMSWLPKDFLGSVVIQLYAGECTLSADRA